MSRPGVTVTTMSAASASASEAATCAPSRSATAVARASIDVPDQHVDPSARNIRTVSAPLTPQPITAIDSAPDRQSASAAITPAAAVRSAVTAAASKSA